jgi:tol-pal system protein YbgF
MKKYFLTVAFICLSVNISKADDFTQSTQDIYTRVSRIEKDLRLLNKEIYNKSDLTSSVNSSEMGSDKNANFEIRVADLENSIRKVKGDIEEISHNQTQISEQIKKIQNDIDFRLNNLENSKEAVVDEDKKIDLSVFEKSPKEKTAAPINVINPDISPEAQYKKAFNLLKENKYDEAEKEFAKFIEKNPNHRLAGNAQYWLAETFYVRGNMEEAMKQFAYGYKTYKDSAKAVDNLLKLGITLGATGKTEDACITFNELETNHNPLPKTITNRIKNEKSKLNCSE